MQQPVIPSQTKPPPAPCIPHVTEAYQSGELKETIERVLNE